MELKESEREENIKIPLFYRIILKVPKLTLDSVTENEKFQGIFWAAILPSFLICDFLLNVLFIAVLSFPLNFLSVIIFNGVIVLFILRILVERALNSEKAYFSKGFNWNFEKSLEDYSLLINRRGENKSNDDKQF